MKYLQITILWLSFSFAIEAQTTYTSYLSNDAEAQKQQLVDAKNCFFKKQENRVKQEIVFLLITSGWVLPFLFQTLNMFS